MRKFQKSFYNNVLARIGVLHGIANIHCLKRALIETHPECDYSIEYSRNNRDIMLVVDCIDFQMNYLCIVNENGYIQEIKLL